MRDAPAFLDIVTSVYSCASHTPTIGTHVVSSGVLSERWHRRCSGSPPAGCALAGLHETARVTQARPMAVARELPARNRANGVAPRTDGSGALSLPACIHVRGSALFRRHPFFAALVSLP